MTTEQSILTTPSSVSSASSSPASSRTGQDTPSLAGAPITNLFEIRQTRTAGRAVFASQDTPKDTLIWRSDDLTLSVLLREYRREVCGQCFAYENGRDLEIRDKTVGFAFCSLACQKKWKGENGEVGCLAWTAAENLVRGRSKEDSDMVDVDMPRPTRDAIAEAWENVAVQATMIRTARESERPNAQVTASTTPVTKRHKAALQKALQQPISPDVMSFCVSGILWLHHNRTAWDNVLALAADDTPYHNTDDLYAFTRTYLHLLAILPIDLLPLVTTETFILLSSRDSHNSFGIRSLEDDGSEFFGYGCWPSASYFNHSCGPNVEKRRVERAWEFRTGRDVGKGEELNITYLSGEERKLGRERRMNRLKRNWGFECACERCAAK